MTPLLEAAAEVAGWLDREGIPYAIIGGLAVARWADPRFTKDVDFTVPAPYGEEQGMAARLVSALRPRRHDAVAFARDSRVVLLHASNGVPVDVALGAHEFELEVVARATDFEFARGCVLRTCSAEDLIVYKLVAARLTDIADVQRVVDRQAPKLDIERIRRWGEVFAELKEDPDLLRPFEKSLARAQE